VSPLLQTFGAASARAFGWSRGSNGGGNAMELISTQILSGTASSVTFSSIPSTYKHLQIRVTTRDTAAGSGNYFMRINGDTGSNYARHSLYANGSTVNSQSASSYFYGPYFYGPYTGNASGVFSAAITDILDYASTSKYKTTRSLSGNVYSGNYDIRLQSGLWMSTSAINSITFTSDATAFAVGSRFSLYGVL
jgi:hypothetical protein